MTAALSLPAGNTISRATPTHGWYPSRVKNEPRQPVGASHESVWQPRARTLPCTLCPGRSIGVCQPLDDERLAYLLSLGRPRRWKRGESMFVAGDAMGHFYKVTKGIVLV